jgi:hypothetical protein
MLIGPKSFAQHRAWLVLVLTATAGAIAWYVEAAWHGGVWPGGGSLPGLTFGVLGAAIILFEMLLWPRKKVRGWRLGRASTWLRAHVWLGLLSLPLVVLHSGFHFGGQLSAVLLTLFLLVIGSGILGLALQQWIPRLLLDEVPAETIYSQIDYVAQGYCYGAEDLLLAACGADPAGRRLKRNDGQANVRQPGEPLVVGAMRKVGNVHGRVLEAQPTIAAPEHAELLRNAFYTTIAPYLQNGSKSKSPLRRANDARRHFQLLASQVDQQTQSLVDAWESLCEQRQQFDLQARLHFVLHAWLWIHVPLSVALTMLLFFHGYTALKYL